MNLPLGSAERCSSDAQVQLGKYYGAWKGVPKNWNEDVRNFSTCGIRKHPCACGTGLMFSKGLWSSKSLRCASSQTAVYFGDRNRKLELARSY